MITQKIKANQVVIWDLDEICQLEGVQILLWSSFSSKYKSDSISLPELIDQNDDYLKTEYLQWLFEIENISTQNLSLSDYFKLEKDFSYWHFTSIAQKKEAFTSPVEITNILKIILFLKILDIKSIKKIYVYSKNINLIHSFKIFSNENKIKFHSNKNIFKRVYFINLFINPVKSCIWLLFYLFKSKSIFNKSTLINTKSDILILDYFDNFNYKSFKKGIFSSNYWGNLINLFKEKDFKINWLHMFIENQISDNEIRKLSNTFNKFNNNFLSHYLLEHSLNFKIIFKSIFIYVKLYILLIKLKFRQKPIFKYQSFNVDSIIWNDFENSVTGVIGLRNCLYINLFDYIFSNISKQKVCFYLQENQGFENALIHFWKKYNHGKLIAISHSTVRYWDLRYFYSKDIYIKQDKYLKLPDYYGVNGDAAKNMLLVSGVPKNKIIELEALRYLDLIDSKSRIPITINKLNNLLIVGSYDNNENKEMVTLLESCIRKYNLQLNISYKQHPNSAYSIKKINSVSIVTITKDTKIKDIVNSFDYILTVNTTSASVEFYYFDIKFIVVNSPKRLNMCPLYKFDNINFVNNIYELMGALTEEKNKIYTNKKSNFFYLNKELNNWSKFLDKIVNV